MEKITLTNHSHLFKVNEHLCHGHTTSPAGEGDWEAELDKWLPHLEMKSRPGIVQNEPLKVFIRDLLKRASGDRG